MIKYCDTCGFLMPESYDACPSCVHGVTVIGGTRIHCRKCDILVSEVPRTSKGDPNHDYVNACDYCSPIGTPSPDEIVSRFFVWVMSPDEPPKRIEVKRTRRQEDEAKASQKQFEQLLRELQDSHPLKKQRKCALGKAVEEFAEKNPNSVIRSRLDDVYPSVKPGAAQRRLPLKRFFPRRKTPDLFRCREMKTSEMR